MWDVTTVRAVADTVAGWLVPIYGGLPLALTRTVEMGVASVLPKPVLVKGIVKWGVFYSVFFRLELSVFQLSSS